MDITCESHPSSVHDKKTRADTIGAITACLYWECQLNGKSLHELTLAVSGTGIIDFFSLLNFSLRAFVQLKAVSRKFAVVAANIKEFERVSSTFSRDLDKHKM